MLNYFSLSGPQRWLAVALPHQVESIYFVWVRVKRRVMGETNV